MNFVLGISFRFRSTALALAVLTGLSGCASFRKASDSMGKWSSDPLLPTVASPVDLISAISDGKQSGFTDKGDAITASQFDRLLATQLAEFQLKSDAAARRNLIQDRLKLSSDQLCAEYKSDVLRKQARANFWLGTTSLFLGAAGAAVSSVNLARGLAGGSALATGVRSEYNQDFFLDQTIAVITKAIDKRQGEILALYTPRRGLPIAQYSVLEAANDVGNYHSACSLAAALSLADRAIESYSVIKSVQDAAASATEYQNLSTKIRNAAISVDAIAPTVNQPAPAASSPE